MRGSMSVAPKYPSTSRLEAFSDGVIAIAITIMVLDLRPPDRTIDHETLPELVSYLWPKIVVYVLSFVIIGKMWISHHQLLHIASHATTQLLWLNMLLLFWMSLIPFATGYVSEDLGRPLAAATYGAVLFLNTASYTMLRHYVVMHLLSPEDRAEEVHPRLIRISVLAMVLYGVGVPVAFISVHAAFALYILVPLLSFPLDMQPRRRRARTGVSALERD
jgi:uncharacterized membrane protein